MNIIMPKMTRQGIGYRKRGKLLRQKRIILRRQHNACIRKIKVLFILESVSNLRDVAFDQRDIIVGSERNIAKGKILLPAKKTSALSPRMAIGNIRQKILFPFINYSLKDHILTRAFGAENDDIPFGKGLNQSLHREVAFDENKEKDTKQNNSKYKNGDSPATHKTPLAKKLKTHLMNSQTMTKKMKRLITVKSKEISTGKTNAGL
jgi:hypothetical protein